MSENVIKAICYWVREIFSVLFAILAAGGCVYALYLVRFTQ